MGGLILAVLLVAFLIYYFHILTFVLAVLSLSMIIVVLGIVLVTVIAVPYYFLKKKTEVQKYGDYELEEFEDSKDRKRR